MNGWWIWADIVHCLSSPPPLHLLRATREARKAESAFSQPALLLAMAVGHSFGHWSIMEIWWVASGKTFCCLDKRNGATISPLCCLEHSLSVTWGWRSHPVTIRQWTQGKGQENDTYSGSDNFKPLNQHLYLPTSQLLGLRKINPYLSFLLLKTFRTDILTHCWDPCQVRWQRSQWIRPPS